MRRLVAILVFVLLNLVAVGVCQQQPANNPYLVRMEHQTRAEDVCMLVMSDGHYAMERVAAGHFQAFGGTLASSAVTELEPLLNASPLVDLKQGQIQSAAAGEEVDQFMLTIPRSSGWQALTFPNSKSRKPYKSELDPILKWLDRNKQQENPIPGAVSTRCVPPQTTAAAKGLATPNASNPYLMRIVVDHYEPVGSGNTFSSVSAGAGTSGPIGGTYVSEAMDLNAFKITRTCAVVYESGRYRFEKSTREAGTLTKSSVFRATLSKAQLDEMRQILDNPKLAALPNNVTPTVMGRAGDLISLTVQRGKNMQAVGFISSAPRPASSDLRESTMAAMSANVGLTNPIRKWVKQSLEDNKEALVQNVPATACIPSAVAE